MTSQLPSCEADLLHSLAHADAPHPNLTWNGQDFINVNNLYDSKMWPDLFSTVTFTKQSKRAPVVENMQRGTEYIFALPKRVGDGVVLESPYHGAKAPSQAHVLVALDYLLTCPLQDPRPRKTRGVVSKGTKAIKDLWARLLGPSSHDEAATETVSDEEPSAADKPGNNRDLETAVSMADTLQPCSDTDSHQEAALIPADKPNTSSDTDNHQEAALSPADTVSHQETTASTAAEEVLTNPLYLPYQPTLELTAAEKFCDKDGNIYQLSFFGQRTCDGCYVDAKAIGDMLGIVKFRSTLTNPSSSYIPGVHFAYIPRDNSSFPQEGCGWSSNPDPSIRWRRVLTYQGLLRVMFTSRKNAAATHYCNWATRMLFAAQLGTEDQRNELVAGLVGYPVEVVRKFLWLGWSLPVGTWHCRGGQGQTAHRS
jgi:hypothetical protein